MKRKEWNQFAPSTPFGGWGVRILRYKGFQAGWDSQIFTKGHFFYFLERKGCFDESHKASKT